MEECGAKEETAALADQHLERAVAALDRVSLVPGPKSELVAIARVRDGARPMTRSCGIPVPAYADMTSPAAAATAATVAAAAAAPRPWTGQSARSWLQTNEGWWKGELETNVTMDAEDLLLRQFLGIRDRAADRRGARWIRSRQRDDGTWATYYGGPPDLSTRIEAYVALRLAGDAVDEPHMQRARDLHPSGRGHRSQPGLPRIWLALFGQWPWEGLPIFAAGADAARRRRIPLNIYDSGAGPGRRWSPSPWSTRTAPYASSAVEHRRVGLGPATGGWRSLTSWAGRFDLCRSVPSRVRAATLGRACDASAPGARALDPQAPRGGTVRGEGSSRLGSTRSWRCTYRAMRWTTR